MKCQFNKGQLKKSACKPQSSRLFWLNMISANCSRCFIGLLKFVFCHDGLRRWREEIWDAVTSNGLHSQTLLPFWRALQPLACSPPPWSGSFLSPYTNQSRAVITAWLKKTSVEEEKSFFLILTLVFRRSTSEISKGNLNSERICFLFFCMNGLLGLLSTSGEHFSFSLIQVLYEWTSEVNWLSSEKFRWYFHFTW